MTQQLDSYVHIQDKLKRVYTHKIWYVNVHSSIAHDSRKVETTQTSVS